MEKIQEEFAKVPALLAKMLEDSTEVKKCRDYLEHIELCIENFKKTGSFKIMHDTSNDDTINKLSAIENTKPTVFNENIRRNLPLIKLERISEVTTNGQEESFENRDSFKENIKIEKSDMPPPQLPVKKNKKNRKESSISSTRSTRSKTSRRIVSKNSCRDSDVILKKQTVDIINLSDSEEESNELCKKETYEERKIVSDNEKSDDGDILPENTKSKSRAKGKDNEGKGKRSRSSSTDSEKESRKTQKRQVKRKKSEDSVYDNAESNRVTMDKATVVNEDTSKGKQLNKTYVTDKKNLEELVHNKLDQTAEDDMIERSPVKKRIEAFEKLGADVSEIPMRTTRTKTKAIKEKKLDAASEIPQIEDAKEKKDAKGTPQMVNRYLTGISYSASKTLKTHFINESLISTKSVSALKASQQEFKEREIRRREKEAETLRKRDALIQAQTEGKRKINLEKQGRAQQLREALEKSKQKTLEDVERAKEEKRKQVLAEKYEKMKKKQNDMERRRMEAMKRAAEEKRKEEGRKRIAEKEQERLKNEDLRKALEDRRKLTKMQEHKNKEKPIYLRQKAPILPTDDYYDSDNESTQNRKIRLPEWTSKEKIYRQIRKMHYVSQTNIPRNFFIMDTTPDLRDIFERIDPKKLIRTSSAVWRVPPRCTIIPPTIAENGEDGDEYC